MPRSTGVMRASRVVSCRFCLRRVRGAVDALDLTEPSLVLGAGAAGQQVVFDLVEPGQHFWVNVEHRAAQAGVLMLASGTVGSRATAQLDLSPVEVLLEFGLLAVGDGLVLIC